MEAKVAAAKQAEAEAEAIVNQAVTEEAQVEEEQRQGKDLTKDAAPGAQAKTRRPADPTRCSSPEPGPRSNSLLAEA